MYNQTHNRGLKSSPRIETSPKGCMNHCIRTDDSIITVIILVNNEPSITNHRCHQLHLHYWPRTKQLAAINNLYKWIFDSGWSTLSGLMMELGKMEVWLLGQFYDRKFEHCQYQRSSACHNRSVNADRQTDRRAENERRQRTGLDRTKQTCSTFPFSPSFRSLHIRSSFLIIVLQKLDGRKEERTNQQATAATENTKPVIVITNRHVNRNKTAYCCQR
jgi:hypothetical protein